MQFIPSTWSVVGVDGDGDDQRDPQDIDDAALATAVYLCSGDEDLSTTSGQRSAVYRYNHSQDYVNLVLAIMEAYIQGDYSSVPNGTSSATVFAPNTGDSVLAAGTVGSSGSFSGGNGSGGDGSGGTFTFGGGGGSGSTGGGSGSTGGDTGSDTDGDDGTTDPIEPPSTEEPTQDPVGEAKKQTEKTVKDVVTPLERARTTCQNNFTSAEIDALGGLDACARAVMSDGVGGVRNSLEDLLGGGGGGGGLLP